MVGYDKDAKKLNYKDIAFAGATSGFITRGLCQPFDVLKIRFQLQVEPISEKSEAKYRSIYQAIKVIVQEEKLKSFWKGHVPAQLLSISYGVSQFWCFEVTSKISNDLGLDANKSLSNFICGSLAGSFATITSFPFDVVRTRLVAQSEIHRIYTGVYHTFYSICKDEGCLVLFRGLFPTIIQVAPHTGVQFMTYKLSETLFRYFIPEINENKSNILRISVVCGGISGLCAKTVIYPLDLAKKRIQIQGFDRKVFGKRFTCNGLVDCLQKTYRIEGLIGLYKGLLPSLIKAVLTSALHFSSYELICLELSKYH